MSGPCVTPLSDLRAGALKEYENAANAVHSWSSVIPRAINFYFDAEEAKAAAVAPPSAPTCDFAGCNEWPHYYTAHGRFCSPDHAEGYPLAASSPPETTAPTATEPSWTPCSMCGASTLEAIEGCMESMCPLDRPHIPGCYGYRYGCRGTCLVTGIRALPAQPVASSATPTPEPKPCGQCKEFINYEIEGGISKVRDHLRDDVFEHDVKPLRDALASSQQEVERIKSAITAIEVREFRDGHYAIAAELRAALTTEPR